MRSLLLAPLVALVLAAGAATTASASTLVYVCGQDLCAAGPHGESPHPLTGDGAQAGGYGSPSLSADGRTLAFRKGKRIFVGDGAAANAHEIPVQHPATTFDVGLRPDGARIAWHESVFEYQIPTGTYNSVDYSYSANAADGSDLRSTGRYLAFSAGQTLSRYTPDGRVLRQTDGNDPRGITHVVCAATDPGAPCERAVALDPGRDLYGAAASPDGRWIAGEAYTSTGADPQSLIALYDASTGALVRDLTTSGHDRGPVFSPDSQNVAFARDDGIYVVPVAGGPVSKVIDGGAQLTWGGTDPATTPASQPAGPAPAPAVARNPAAAARALSRALRTAGLAGLASGKPLAIAYRAARAGGLTLAVRSRGAVVLRGARTFRRAGTATVRVRVTPAGRRALRRARKVRLAVTARFAPRRGRAASARAAVTLAR